MDDLSRDGPFDLLLTDTSLFQSIVAAVECANGKRVLQIDPEPFYGGPSAGSHKVVLSPGKNVIYDPSPIVFYARGPLADLLIDLELTDYIDFIAIDQQFIWPSRQVLIPLPLSKEQIMLETGLTLLEKRKLTRLLGLAATMALTRDTSGTLADLFRREQVSPESRVYQLIAYGACRCDSVASVESLPLTLAIKIIESLRLSVGHLPNSKSPFVIPIWGSSELSQAACRKAAVFGCIQILETEVSQLPPDISFNQQISRSATDSPKSMRRILLLNRPILGVNSSVLLTIPPGSDLNPNSTSPAINVLQLTFESQCCPQDSWLVYMWPLVDEVNDVENLLVSASFAQILWSKTVQICANFYTDQQIPYQPLQAASYKHEEDFVNSLKSFSNY